MSEAKHTPGPWMIMEYGDDDSPNLVIHSSDEKRICFLATPGSHGDPAKIEADARLIAAAPDLLRALRVVERAHSTSGYIGLIREAIAKAMGDDAS